MSQLIETPRLSLRPFSTTDQEHLFLLYSNAVVMGIRKIGVQTKEGSNAQLQIILEHWSRKEFGLWAVFSREENEFMGECGLRELSPGTDEIELSYGLIPAFWGIGYASEAATAVIEYGFMHLGLNEILGVANGENKTSLHVLKKLGFKIEHMAKEEDGTIAHSILSQDQWINARDGGSRGH